MISVYTKFLHNLGKDSIIYYLSNPILKIRIGFLLLMFNEPDPDHLILWQSVADNFYLKCIFSRIRE